ncbi:MAG: enoyl-CoA hydratase/isomerase family protein [Rhodospirillaceae bacterium]|nr:enoyl-CoA hydratase/isomerase family protein [Rhodospirillaceae bacterium]
MAGTVKLDIDGAVATLTLDNPTKRNSIDLPMAAALAGAARAIAADDRLGAVVLRGAGERAFCAGADFDALTAGGAMPEAFAAMEAAVEEAMAALEKIEIPLIAAIDGACFGAGVQFAFTADTRIASADARFGIPAATLGIVYPLGAIAAMIRAAGPGLVTQFLLGAEPIDAAGALAHRFVDRVVAKHEVQETAAALARRIAGHPRAATRAYKAIIRGLAEGRAMSDMRDIQHRAHQSPELAARLAALKEKRGGRG